jgi:LEA14-like dessication related protein
MKPASAKAKGRRAAAELKILIHAYYPELEMDDVRVTSSGSTGEDLLLSPKARRLLPFTFECKNVEKLNIWDALLQAQEHAEGTQHTPALAFRRNKSELYVALKARDFLRLVRKEEE